MRRGWSNTPTQRKRLAPTEMMLPTGNSKASVTRSPIPWKIVVPPEKTTLACKSLRMSDVTLVDETWREQHSRATEALGANSDDVSVWELEGKRHALANPLENGRAA